MKETKQIDISVAVNAYIEQHRLNFTETANDILTRLFNLSTPASNINRISQEEEINGWTTKGITFKNGTLLRMIYNDQKYYGKITNNKLVVNSKKFSSFSEAASELAKTKQKKQTNLNGWALFEYRNNEQEDWKPVKDLRK